MSKKLNQLVQKKTQALLEPSEPPKKLSRIALRREDQRLWSFSFRFWEQLKYFGLKGNEIDNQWMVNVLDRFKELSTQTVDKVILNGGQASADRYHAIDWTAKNIPIQRSQITSIPSEYSGEEYELHQFQVSKGEGRIVGFFDEKWVFNIVLFDPLHNIQPSKYNDYSVRPCFPLDSEFAQMQEGISKCLEHCEAQECKAAAKLKDMATGSRAHFGSFGILMIKVANKQIIDDLNQTAEAKGIPVEQILSDGITVNQ